MWMQGFGQGASKDKTWALQKKLPKPPKGLMFRYLEKANKDGRKHLQRVPLTKEGSIPHEVIGEFCSARIKLIPASEGTGIIAGTSVRAVAEMAGIKNLLSKSMGSTNPINLVKATLDALAQLRTPEQVEELRSTKL